MRFSLLICTILLMTNCDKTKYVTMVYDETYCNKWNQNTTTTSKSRALIEVQIYFSSQYDIEFKNSFTKDYVGFLPTCAMCECKTGKQIVVEVEEAFIPILQDENFYLD